MKHNATSAAVRNSYGVHKGNATALLSLCFIFAILFTSCASLAPFSQVELAKITALKAESLDLMSRATSAFAGNKTSIDALKARLNDAHLAAVAREKNESAAKQWAIMKDPAANLLGGFLARWESRGTLSETFVTEASKLVSSAFDQLIELENGRSR